MGYVILLFYILIQPICVGMLLMLWTALDATYYKCWIWGSGVNIFFFGLVYIIQLNCSLSRVEAVNILQWLLLAIGIISAIGIICYWIKNRKLKLPELFLTKLKGNISQYFIAACFVLLIGLVMSLIFINHNAYGDDLIRYEYLFRLDTNQLEYYDFTDVMTKKVTYVLSFRPIQYYFIYINEMTKLPPVISSEAVTLGWTFFMSVGIYFYIANYFYGNEKKKRDFLFLLVAIVYIVAIFSDKMTGYQIYVGPWNANVIFCSIAAPALFMTGIKIEDNYIKNGFFYKENVKDIILFLCCGMGCVLCKWKLIDFTIPLIIGMLIIGYMGRRLNDGNIE